MATTEDILKYLADNNVEFSARMHAPAFSAYDLAMANHVHERNVVVPTVLRAENHYFMAVLPGNCTLNRKAMQGLLGDTLLQPINRSDLERLFPAEEAGAIPPLGNLYGIPVIADTSFDDLQPVVFHACSFTQSISMEWREYKRLTRPVVGPIAERVRLHEKHTA